VGGSVRDALLDRGHSDIDVATDAHPEAVERLVRGWAEHVWTQGARFGTVGCEFEGTTIEMVAQAGPIVPEPGTLSLLAMGLAAAVRRARRSR
jgi:hypothetical protein